MQPTHDRREMLRVGNKNTEVNDRKAVGGRRRVDGRHARLRILTNKCYDLCRKRRPTVDLEDMADRLPSESQDHDQRMTLWQAVLSLPEDLRVPVTLFYYEDLSVREIGQVLGISEAAVKTRLSRGRGRLRLLLEEK